MKIEIEALGMSMRREIDYGLNNCTMGYGEIYLPELKVAIKGVNLVWRKQQVVAFAPRMQTDSVGPHWDPQSPFARKVADALYGLFLRMGGQPVPSASYERDESLSLGIAPAANHANAARRVKTKPETAGLLRTLGAVEETMEKAGL